MKIFTYIVCGDCNFLHIHTQRRKAERARAKDIKAGENVMDINEFNFPISREGILNAFKAGAAQAGDIASVSFEDELIN